DSRKPLQEVPRSPHDTNDEPGRDDIVISPQPGYSEARPAQLLEDRRESRRNAGQQYSGLIGRSEYRGAQREREEYRCCQERGRQNRHAVPTGAPRAISASGEGSREGL